MSFGETAVAELGDRDRFVLVNYLRSAIGQEKGGHISPLAAYDADSDRFLMLDVSRYKYPPIWVEAAALFDAMNTPDADNENRSRGFVDCRPLTRRTSLEVRRRPGPRRRPARSSGRRRCAGRP